MNKYNFTLTIFVLGGFLTTTNIFKYTVDEFRKKVNLTTTAACHVFIEAAKTSVANVK